ncbi:hypothetical protein [Actinokineospora terrae]|uniref:Uncharacterized protein n=1 Tax=Actinokineospora terrae TaxID=155974 RepID=A0A1H9PE24_9PSEU|nr:hypothetical protein [Actinokineospora terrae]SER45813.1 hypothetical protein SAMN04487818_103389 [Actinokineospora terrae]
MSVDEHALRDLLAGPAPAGTTSLEEVVRRGRRLVYVRAAKTSTIMVLVVGLITGSLSWLQGAQMPPAVLRLLPSEADWPRVDLRPSTTPRLWNGGGPPRYVCPVTGEPQVGYGEVSGAVLGVTRTAVSKVLSKTKIGYWDALTGGTSGTLADLDLTDTNGVGSLAVRSAIFTGSPTSFADALAFTDSNCEPPKRLVTQDGTVVQVYPEVPSEPYVTLTMRARIFRPNGSLVVLEVRSFGSVHLRQTADGAERLPGRTTLPMTEAQLAQVAAWVAAA